ncbi:MAG: AAA family ATPase [Wenzhouxiangella sp.]
MSKFTIPPEQLRWQPDSDSVPTSSTRDAQKLKSIVGQPRARVALRFALTTSSRNHNVYVRGPEGCGRRALVASMLAEMKAAPEHSCDFCYVHNFANPDRPRLIVLPGGQGNQFQHAMTRIGLFVRDRLPDILKNDPIRSRREARKEAAEREIRAKVAPLEKKLRSDGLALIRTQSGPSSRIAIYPQIMGKPVSPEEYRNLVTQNQAREEDRLAAVEKSARWQGEVNRFAREVSQIWQQAMQHIDQINASETARILGELTAEVGRKFKASGMDVYLREIIDDIVEKRVGRDTSHLAEPTQLYGVNVLTSRSERDLAPVVFARQPSVPNLFGAIDPGWMSSGRAVTSFRGIRTGAMLEADGGFLVLDAADAVAEPGCWRMLMRTLRTGLAEVVPPELGWPYSAQSLKPEPIPIKVRVILTGDAETFSRLNREDRDFPQLFKVLADFDDTLARDQEGINGYTRFLAQLVDEEELTHFDRSGIQAMLEHGARLAGEPERLSARFSELADLACEASGRARDDGSEDVLKKHVEQAARQRRERAGLPFVRTLRAVDQGRLEINARGRADGRLNAAGAGRTGTLAMAMPMMVSASFAAAESCHLSIDDSDHVEWLSILLGQTLHMDTPIRITARISTRPWSDMADESLDLARVCCLLGALAGVPLQQGVAVIGTVDDDGLVGPARDINERIEAHFELCRHGGLSGSQGVIIPRANVGELMLDREILKACANSMFSVQAVNTLAQTLELISGARVGTWKDGAFVEDSLLWRARTRLMQLGLTAPQTG